MDWLKAIITWLENWRAPSIGRECPYVFVVPCNDIAASSTKDFTPVVIGNDADFELHEVLINHEDDADTDFMPNNCSLKLKLESPYGRDLTSDFVPARLLQGIFTGGLRKVVIPAGGKLSGTVKNLIAAEKDTTVVFRGVKKYKA